MANRRRAAGSRRPLASAPIAPRFSIVTPVYNPPLGAFLACADGVRRPDVHRLGVVRGRRLLHPAGGASPRSTRWRRPTRASASSAGRPTAGSSPRPTTRWRWPPASSSPCSTTTTAGPTRRSARWPRTTRPGRRRRLPVHRRGPRAHRRAGRRPTSSSRTGRPERFRSSMYTCHLSVLRRSVVERDRRVPRRLRRLAGPRPDPAGDRGDHRRRPPRRPPPGADLPLAQRVQLGVAGQRHAGHGDRARPPGRAGAVRPVWASTPRSSTATSTAATGSVRRIPPSTQGHRRRRHRRRAVRRATATGWPRRRRCAACARRCRNARSSSPTRPTSPGASSTCSTRPPATAGTASRSTAVGPGRGARPGGADVPRRRPGQRRPRPRAPSDVTPDWLETLTGLALQPGVGLAGGLVATPGGVVVHAGWDVPELPLVRAGGDARRHHQLGQRPVHRARVQPGDARRRGHRHPRTGTS